MIKTKNNGILEAMEILKNMSLRKTFRYLYEERLKAIRDRKAEDDFVRAEGKAEGRVEGRAEGRVEGRAEGKTEGKAEDVLDLLMDVGTVPNNLQEKIYAQKDLDVLRKWHKLAARVKSIEEFEAAIKQ